MLMAAPACTGISAAVSGGESGGHGHMIDGELNLAPGVFGVNNAKCPGHFRGAALTEAR